MTTPASPQQVADADRTMRDQLTAGVSPAAEVELGAHLRTHTARVCVIGSGYVGVRLALAPERIVPGNRAIKVRDIPKIVGGVTPACTRLAGLLYRQIVGTVLTVSGPKVAELAKLYENVFRNVNIALANEFALMCRRLGVNTREVIEETATTPLGLMPIYPGPGTGGHCIPVDPGYLAWKMRLE